MGCVVEIGILGGTGPEGSGLALRLAQAGLSVRIGSRSLEKAKKKTEELRQKLEGTVLGGKILGEENPEVLKTSRLVFLTVPFEQAVALLRTCQPWFRAGQILVDVTVPLEFGKDGLQLRKLDEPSGSEHLARVLPDGVSLVAGFKTIPARLLENVQTPLDCHVFICGDSEDAKSQVVQLTARLPGLAPLDVGSLREAGTLERMAALAIQINKRYRVKFSRFRLVGL